MKNEKWTEDLYLYRMNPAPPKKNDLQEYIYLYCAEKDDKYLNWFFHYYEPRLNTIIMQTGNSVKLLRKGKAYIDLAAEHMLSSPDTAFQIEKPPQM